MVPGEGFEPPIFRLQGDCISHYANPANIWRLVLESNQWNNYLFGSLANCWFKPLTQLSIIMVFSRGFEPRTIGS